VHKWRSADTPYLREEYPTGDALIPFVLTAQMDLPTDRRANRNISQLTENDTDGSPREKKVLKMGASGTVCNMGKTLPQTDFTIEDRLFISSDYTRKIYSEPHTIHNNHPHMKNSKTTTTTLELRKKMQKVEKRGRTSRKKHRHNGRENRSCRPALDLHSTMGLRM
jgi:hypothetical protein